MPGNLEFSLNFIWTPLAVIFGTVVYILVASRDRYATIPAIGRTGVISSYIDAIRFIKQADIMLQEGYAKYKPGSFRVAQLDGWLVILCGKNLIRELLGVPDEVLSSYEASRDVLAADYTLGPEVVSDSYHVPILRRQLTRNLPVLLPSMHDELVSCFEKYIPTTDEWSPVRAMDAIMKIISQTSNRIFVGAPTCRDSEYIKLNIQFTIDVMIGGKIINAFPSYLKPLAGYLFTNVPRAIRTGLKHLGPVIENRLRKIDEYGIDYPDKPKDMLSWLIDEAKGEQRSVRNLTLRIMVLNLAAIHTTSATFTKALYHLATRPEYIQPIREEIEGVIAEPGWEKASMTSMIKLDSFLKECQRFDGISAVTMIRKAMKDFTFADGTVVPEGGFVGVLSQSVHQDGEYYPDGNTFKGFRFSDLPEVGGKELKGQMMTTSSSYLPWGLGKHACPGRFFAVHLMKVMMGHLIMTYDVKMANGGVRPPQRYGIVSMPDPKAQVLFRKRRT